MATIEQLQKDLKAALSRIEVLEARSTARKAPRKPRVPKAKPVSKPRKPKAKKSMPTGYVWWGPEQDGKDPMKEYVPPAAGIRVSPGMEQAYKFMLTLPKHMTWKKYNLIQAARLYYNDHGECPPDMNDLLYLDSERVFNA